MGFSLKNIPFYSGPPDAGPTCGGHLGMCLLVLSLLL